MIYTVSDGVWWGTGETPARALVRYRQDRIAAALAGKNPSSLTTHEQRRIQRLSRRKVSAL